MFVGGDSNAGVDTLLRSVNSRSVRYGVVESGLTDVSAAPPRQMAKGLSDIEITEEGRSLRSRLGIAEANRVSSPIQRAVYRE